MMRSCIDGPAHLCSAEFIVTHAARSRCSSSRWIRLSRFVSSRFDRHAETMEWRGREQRRILESPPVDRRTQHAQCAVDRRHLTVFRFEATDVSRFLQRRHGQVTECGLERFHVSEDRAGALEAFGFDVGGLVAIEKLRHRQTTGGKREGIS
jgi:hypothetical protein